MSWGYYGFRPYVPVAKRRAQAATYAAKLAKKENRQLAPVNLPGRKIASSFWGQAWCENLERYSDYENRLPRGRTYVRNGSVIDLQIERGKIKALVSGSEVYRVTITIQTVPAAQWSRIKRDCAHSVASLIDLLQGRFDQGIMARLSQRDGGLFPQPKEIKMSCRCPDWAGMCKHVAAVLYGVGTRLDTAPELLFTLRDVDHLELIGQAVDAGNLDRILQGKGDASLAGSDLGEIFGIELEQGSKPNVQTAPPESTKTTATKTALRPRASKKPAAAPKAKKKGKATKSIVMTPKARSAKKPARTKARAAS